MEPVMSFDVLIRDLKSNDIRIYNTAIEWASTFSAFTFLDYLEAKEGPQFALRVARSLCFLYQSERE